MWRPLHETQMTLRDALQFLVSLFILSTHVESLELPLYGSQGPMAAPG